MLSKSSFLKIALITCMILMGIFCIPVKASAANGANFNAGRIIDDSVFTNKTAMSVVDIQNFLNGKVPVCDTNHQGGSANYPPPYVCLKNFSEGGRSAAQIIYDAAQQYDINPQVIIATLEKENGLITDTWPYSWQYRTAMGMGCPDGAACDTQYYGFTNQVNQGTRHLHNFQIQNPAWIIPHRIGLNNIKWYTNTNCGTSQVNIENGATSALYSYTPYRPNQAALNNMYGTGDSCSSYGNRNFWRNFTDWFGSTSGKAQVVKGVNGTQLFAVWGTTKYYLPTYDMMIAWGLHRTPVSTVADSYLANLQDGGQLSNIAKSSDDSNSPLFLFDDGKRYPIPANACKTDLNGQPITNTSWALDCLNSNVSKAYPSSFIQSVTVQDIALPTMIAFGESVWKIEAGKKRRIVDGLIIDVLGGWGQVRWMKDLNANQPQGKIVMRNGYTVRFTNSPVVYQFDSEQLNEIPSPNELSSWGINTIRDIPYGYNSPDPLPIGTAITQVAQSQNGAKYIIDKGYKLFFPPDTDAVQWPTSTPTVTLPATLKNLTAIPLSSIYLSDAGEIFTVYGSKRYVFPTMDDFFRLGFNPALIRRVSTSVANLPGMSYGGMHMSSGRLYKINNNLNQIYITQGSHSLYVNSINYPGLPYDKIITVDPITGSRYPVIGTYQP